MDKELVALVEEAPAGGDARGHNIALDTQQTYCGSRASRPHSIP